jgi:hypothetical protein
MDVIRPRAIIFLVIDVPKTSANLVVFLLRRSRLRPFVPRLLRPLRSSALLLIEHLATCLLRVLASLLALLPGLLSSPLLTLLALALLLSPTLFVGPTLSFRILCGLVLLVLIGQCGLLWLNETGSTIAACCLSDEPVSPIAIDRNLVTAGPRGYYGIE